MSELLVLGFFVGMFWMIASSYIQRWKRNNPGEPVFKWDEPAQRKFEWRRSSMSMKVKGGPKMGSFDPNEAMKW